jgi:hypothetical protein
MHTTENTNAVVKIRLKISVPLALATPSIVTTVTGKVQLLFTIYTSNNTKINTWLKIAI